MNEEQTIGNRIRYILYKMTFPNTRDNIWWFFHITLKNVYYKIRMFILDIKVRKLKKRIEITKREINRSKPTFEAFELEAKRKQEEEKEKEELLAIKQAREEGRERRKDIKENVSLATACVGLITAVFGAIGKAKRM